MSININTKELKNLLDSTPPSHNIMLSGKHGIGKSKIITDHFSAKGQKVVTLFLDRCPTLETLSVCRTRTRRPARPYSCHLTGSRRTTSRLCFSSTN